MFLPFAGRFMRAFQRLRNYDPETEYLNEAGDVYDLEKRQIEIARGRFARHRPFGF
ncbi:DUF3563 domain-containing protein [Pseudoxanthobacter sp.]|uniref:DUF3563 domain-containing protein n=1 Tax=Pseudoxanthobacter sp. TaxID=1925742 RepID=UPI002FE04034